MKQMMKAAVCAGALFGVWSLEAKTVAFYPFSDREADSTVTAEAVVNAAEDGIQYEASVAQKGVGTLPTFSDDVPGSYIYDDTKRVHLVASNDLRSLAFACPENTANGNGAYVLLKALGKSISELDSFTIECFVKVESSMTWRNAFAFTANQGMKLGPQVSSTALGIQNLTLVNKGGDQLYAANKATGEWHHVAITYTKDEDCVTSENPLNRARLWVDYATPGTIVWTNAVSNTGDFYFGSSSNGGGEHFYGKVCALRITDRILDKTEFMIASEFTHDDALAFYPFKDGAVGETVSKVVNAVNVINLGGTASSRTDADSAAPTFTEGPGPYLYSTSTGMTLVCASPQGIRFAGSEASGSYGGKLALADMSTQLSYLDEFTVEFFAKFEGVQNWRTLLEYNAGVDCKIANNASSSIVFQDKSKGTGVNILASNGSSFKDGRWHHIAFTYSRSDNTTTLYLDYAKKGSNKSVTNNLLTTSVNMTLGGHMSNHAEYFNGSIAALRVTERVLSEKDFLNVTDVERYDSAFERGIVYHWALDGADGDSVLTARAAPFDVGAYQGKGSGISGGHAPYYSTSAINQKRVRIWNGERFLPRRNTACAEFFGKREPTDGEWTGSLLEETALPAEEHPRSFTYEMFVKVRNAHEDNELMMGKGLSDNNLVWKVFTRSQGGFSVWFYPVDADGVAGAAITQSPVAEKAFTPNVWHHLALTYDHEASPRKLVIYLDYKPVYTYEFPEGKALLENTSYRFRHGRYCNTHGFNGWMDEIRLYRGVLQPEQFLRFKSEDGTLILVR